LVDCVTRDKALPSEVLEQIVAKTDGVPLFVEELTKAVLGSGLLREENGAYVLVSALIPLAIPSTLQDSLMARLDRLAPVREIAQIAAAIGREFSYRLLEAVAPIQGPALQSALGQLMAAELIHGRGSPPEATYVFKHALVQDTAYASMLHSRRQSIHADIARAMEKLFADQVQAAPAILARHYTEARLAEPAARYWLKAAELALSRSAPVEAESYVDGGMALLSRLTDESDRRFLELSLRLARSNALLQVKGWAAPETVAAFTAAKQLLDAGAGTDLQRFSVLFGLCQASMVAARMEPALALAREIVAVAERQDDTIYRLVGHRLVGVIQFMMGRNREALESLHHCERYSDPVRQKKLSYRFGTDPGLVARCFKTHALQSLGLHDQAARVTEQVLAELPSHGHAFTVAFCNGVHLVALELHFGDLEACERHSAELVTYCVEKKVEQWRYLGLLYYACARATREPTEENIAALRTALAAKHASGAFQLDSFLMAHLAQALLTAGEVTGAEAALKEAFAFVEQSGERYWLADLHRVEGRIALERPEPDHPRAAACFLQAIEVAQRQEARMLELRAATDLARLWRDTGSNDDPRMLLEPILAAIQGGENKRDVRYAHALLAEIG
jgi:tetratricopeptide (TPR) repeat protein